MSRAFHFAPASALGGRSAAPRALPRNSPRCPADSAKTCFFRPRSSQTAARRTPVLRLLPRCQKSPRECEQRAQVLRLAQLALDVRGNAEEFRLRGKIDAEIPHGVAIYFEQFKFQHHLAARLIDFAYQFARKGQPFRRVTHGNRAALRVELYV